jgi:hypothetical protein
MSPLLAFAADLVETLPIVALSSGCALHASGRTLASVGIANFFGFSIASRYGRSWFGHLQNLLPQTPTAFDVLQVKGPIPGA